MTNVIDFQTKKPADGESVDAPVDDTDYVADLLNRAAELKFEDIIMIGRSADGKVACLLTTSPEEAVYELTHAVYQLNKEIAGDR